MTDLRARMRIYDQAPAPDYWSEVELRASTAPQAGRPSRSARPALLLVAALLVILTISAAVAVGSGVVEVPWLDESPTPAPSTGQPAWTGPVRAEDGEPLVEPMVPAGDGSWTWDEPEEALPGWLDVVRLSIIPDGQVHWYLELGDWPPAESESVDAIIGHGLVLDATGDGTADYVVGIDNDVPQPGDLHVWVANLESGITEEQIGPPYGYPVEFSHPAEAGDDAPTPTVAFTFLTGSPRGVDTEVMRWYAWASATVGGEVVTWDYSPDAAWVGPPGGTASASVLPGLGMPGMNLDEPAGEYGWQGRYGSTGWMHRVFEDSRETELRFAIQNNCFGGGGDPVPMTVAGLDGLYVEPYEDAPGTPRLMGPGATTAAYALPIRDRTLCVYLAWDADIRPDELDAARQVVESIRGVPVGEDGIRINFTLPFGWDTG